MAFCHWLSAELESGGGAPHNKLADVHSPSTWTVRLPTEQEWQRAAVGDSGWRYPWGDQLDETRANYGQQVGHPTRVGSYPDGKSPYEVMDMVGNVWEWCLTTWGVDGIDISGYTYRLIRGGAWNVRHPDYLRATDRGGNSPRGRLNDCGFRCVYCYQR
jgi:formylglycine-generating enzyme required for sulfatase activity